MKDRRLRTAFVFFITALMITAFAYYIYVNADRYLKLLNVSLTGVFVLVLLSLALPVLNGIQNTILYRELGVIEFSYMDGFFISATSSLANQLPIPGGVVSKAYYLKRKYNVPYLLFTSSTLALFFFYVALNGAVGTGVLLYLMLIKKTAISPILFIGFFLMIGFVSIFWAPMERIAIPNRLQESMRRALDGWFHISKNPLMVLKQLILQFIMILFLSIRYWFAFRMLSQDIAVSQLLLMSSASILTQMVTIAPGGIGVRESIVGAVAALTGFDAGVSVVAVGLDRLVSTFVKFLVGGISAVILSNQIARLAPEDKENSAS